MISSCLASEQRMLVFDVLIAGPGYDLFSENNFGRLSSVVVDDGRNQPNPLRGDQKRPGIRYTTKEKTTIIRNNLKVPIC